MPCLPPPSEFSDQPLGKYDGPLRGQIRVTVPNGTWGKMTYRIMAPAFRFVFNGHKLQPGVAYTLIYYPDPWPGNNLTCLGSGIADQYGDVHIAGSIRTDSLALSSDVDCVGPPPHIIGWNPTQYLFEHNLIVFTQTS